MMTLPLPALLIYRNQKQQQDENFRNHAQIVFLKIQDP